MNRNRRAGCGGASPPHVPSPAQSVSVEAQRKPHGGLAAVAHDLRNPLAVIEFIAARLIQERTPDKRTIDFGLEAILRSVRRAERLVRDLLDEATDELPAFDVKPTSVPAAQLLEEAVTAGEALAAHASVELVVTPTSDLPPVGADRERIAQVFGNLIENAAKYTPRGGRIALRAVAVDAEVHFSVADTGPGIDEQDRTRAFAPFWQAERHDQSGRGLGLWICKQIVESHGGRIWIESPEVGATLVFSLPCSASGMTETPSLSGDTGLETLNT